MHSLDAHAVHRFSRIVNDSLMGFIHVRRMHKTDELRVRLSSRHVTQATRRLTMREHSISVFNGHLQVGPLADVRLRLQILTLQDVTSEQVSSLFFNVGSGTSKSTITVELGIEYTTARR